MEGIKKYIEIHEGRKKKQAERTETSSMPLWGNQDKIGVFVLRLIKQWLRNAGHAHRQASQKKTKADFLLAPNMGNLKVAASGGRIVRCGRLPKYNPWDKEPTTWMSVSHQDFKNYSTKGHLYTAPLEAQIILPHLTFLFPAQTPTPGRKVSQIIPH